MQKGILAFVIIAILAVGLMVFKQLPLFSNKTTVTMQDSSPELSTENPEIDYQATFAIFTNGTFRIFKDSKYHNLSPDVYLESSNPNIIHVKKAGITYNDFFKTLPMKLTKDCLTTGTNQTFCSGSKGVLKFYLNGTRNDNLLDLEIKDGDKILISFGAENEIQTQLDQIP